MNRRETQEREIHFCIDSVLDGNFRPASPKHRDRETECLIFAARTANNLLIRGPPGTGKTLVIKEVFERIRKEKSGIFPVYINTRMHASRYMIFSEIYVQLSGSGEYPVNQSFQKLEKAVWRLIDRHGCRLLVCLDDACFIRGRNTLNDTLHSLLKFGEIHDGAGIAVWVVASEPGIDPASRTEKSVRTLFSPAEVFFRPYDRDRMEDILLERIGPAVWRGMLSAGAFELILDRACLTGDPRSGIGLYHRSAFAAAIECVNPVNAGIVRDCIAKTEEYMESMILDSMPLREREVYLIIRELSVTGMEMAMTPVFRIVHDRMGICYSLFFRAVNRLEESGLIGTDLCTGRGRKRVIELKKME